jgi:hypothetical protein
MTRLTCNVCCKKTSKVFKCKDCNSIICLQCGKFYEDYNYCVYCQSYITNLKFTKVYIK